MGVRVENTDWKYLPFNFDGTINRARSWVGVVAEVVMNIAQWILLAAVLSAGPCVVVGIAWLLVLVFNLALIWMGLLSPSNGGTTVASQDGERSSC
jgi:uncharacterized membrane protein YhaH (DUF805 family)